MRERLSKPIGKLYAAKKVDSAAFREAIKAPPMVVSVGDRVTETIGKMGRVPEVQIIDSRENRKDRAPPDVPFVRAIKVRNPAGSITLSAIEGIREAFGGAKPARVQVEGEEDLLAIPAIVFGPISSIVFYGQPGEGIVAVKVDARSKSRSRAVLAEMGIVGLR